jgi:hypothetical protein
MTHALRTTVPATGGRRPVGLHVSEVVGIRAGEVDCVRGLIIIWDEKTVACEVETGRL